MTTRFEQIERLAAAMPGRFVARECDHCGDATISGHDSETVCCSGCGTGNAIKRRREARS